MVWLKFAGWFQCRLATDPDPTDESRGVSGYAASIAGEPDLDRIVRFHAPVAPRSHCPTVGVRVANVFRNGAAVSGDPLLGARVELMGEPKFEGRNGIIAEAGFEPIVPFHLRVASGRMSLDRPHLDQEEPPYTELQASGINSAPGAIAEATGIWDIRATWSARLQALQQDLANSTKPESRAALAQRMETLSNARLTRFFAARMQYALALQGAASVSDPDGLLGGTVDTAASWPVELWCGAWDPDALCGFVQGFLGVPMSPLGSAVMSADSGRDILEDFALLAKTPQR